MRHLLAPVIALPRVMIWRPLRFRLPRLHDQQQKNQKPDPRVHATSLRIGSLIVSGTRTLPILTSVKNDSTVPPTSYKHVLFVTMLTCLLTFRPAEPRIIPSPRWSSKRQCTTDSALNRQAVRSRCCSYGGILCFPLFLLCCFYIIRGLIDVHVLPYRPRTRKYRMTESFVPSVRRFI